MTEIRRKFKHNVKAIPTDPLRDKTLSYKARGIYAMIMTMPDNWKGHKYHMVEQSDKDGDKSVSSGLKELVDNGYAILRYEKKVAGQFQGSYYEFFDEKIKVNKNE